MGNTGIPDAGVFGRRVREERERLKWHLRDLAAACAAGGLVKVLTFYSKVENGYDPKLSEARDIAAALGVPLGALLIDTSEIEEAVGRLRTQANDAARESDDALRRALHFQNEAQRLAAEVRDD